MIPTEFPFSYPIASQVLGAPGLSDNWGNERLVNAAFVNQGGANAVLTLYDSNGVSQTFQIISGAPVKIKRANVRSWSITGNGATIQGMFSWPAEPEPSAFQLGSPEGNTSVVAGTLIPKATAGTLYTCPLGFRATLVRATVTADVAGGGPYTVFLIIRCILGGVIGDEITPISGQSIIDGEFFTIGSGPGNSIVIPGNGLTLYSNLETGQQDIVTGLYTGPNSDTIFFSGEWILEQM